MDKGYSVDAIFLNFQKAFDKVPKTRLLQKLSSYGVKGKVLCRIADFLSYRKMRMMVRGEYSEWRKNTELENSFTCKLATAFHALRNIVDRLLQTLPSYICEIKLLKLQVPYMNKRRWKERKGNYTGMAK